MWKIVSLVVLILVLAGAAWIWVQRSPEPPQPSPKQSVAAPRASSSPSNQGQTVTIRTYNGSGVQEKIVKRPDRNLPFSFDDSKPLGPQVRGLLGAPCPWEKDVLEACRERKDAVIAELVAILKDPSAGYNPREKALGMLAHLSAASALPAILEVAKGDLDPQARVAAIGTLNDFLGAVKAADVRSIFEGSRTLEEKTASVDVLGNLGDPASLGFLEELARSFPDSLMLQKARQAADKVKVLNSPKKEVELVQILNDEDHPLQEWALNRIVVEKKPEMAHYLREALDTHRKLPKDKVNATFEYNLLAGIRDLGQELSPGEKEFVDKFSVENDAPLPD
jgi:hypothetical protein